MKIIKFSLLAGILLFSNKIFPQDPNFYIYLCFGQSNMQGAGPVESQDLTVDSRFKLFQSLDCPNLGRTKAKWYTAVPPTCQCYSGLSPADYFGRTMVASLPDSITIGIVNVSIAGCDIRIFDKDLYMDYDSTSEEAWFLNLVKAYEGNPYEYLINLAESAQQDGVIKGILLHQGETNTGDPQWPLYVQAVYNNMLTDLSLEAESTPLLAGELVDAEQGGCCSLMNTIIDELPNTIPTAHFISSGGCTVQADKAHFTSEGYRILGKRYAEKMLSLMGFDDYVTEAECGIIGDSCIIRSDQTASNERYVTKYPGTPDDTSLAPVGNTDVIQFNFTLSKDTNYYVYGRFNNPDTGNDSYWIKMDEGDFELINNLTTSGWQWLETSSYELTTGTHSLSVAFVGDGASLDKIVIKSTRLAPAGPGVKSDNVCTPEISTVGMNQLSTNGYSLEQNYPNPFFEETSITFKIPAPAYVSIKVFNIHGIEISEPGGTVFRPGTHTVNYHFNSLPAGSYYYTMKTDQFFAARKMLVLAK